MKNTIITLSDIDKIMLGLYSKISRSNIKPICTQKMLRYSDVMKIKNKEV